MITRNVNGQSYTLNYDAENRLIEVKKNSTTVAQFTYDGDGKRVKSVIGSDTTLFVGSHYEVTGSTVTKYYYAGTQRIAMRENGVLTYILSDHLGSTSIVTDSAGTLISETKYKAWGETRYSSGTSPTDYTYTGQYSYADDFGLMFYNARWYDPSLGRFAQADTIVPSGVQGLDRYAYVNNSPVMYTDPSGHNPQCGPDGVYCDNDPSNDLVYAPLLTFSTEGNRTLSAEAKSSMTSSAWDVAVAFANEIDAQCAAEAAMGMAEECTPTDPATAFHSVYGGSVNVVRKSGTCSEFIGNAYPGCTAWGYSNGANEIWIFDSPSGRNMNDFIISHPNLIVHELGHSFATAANDFQGFTDVGRNGFYDSQFTWQISYDGSPGEIFGDMFVGWVYGKWEPGTLPSGLSRNGQAKRDLMYEKMPLLIDMAIGR